MKQHIQTELKKLEQRHDIRILYAVESGSRAWGFESVNSDWDVRFLYVHRLDWYLSINDKKETIEEMLPNGLDLSGWELRKALNLFRRSNPPLMEWLRSPIIYREQGMLAKELRALSKQHFNPKASLQHYFHMADGNYKDYLQEEEVSIKKYFYVLRPLLACAWIEKFEEFPPMEFDLLVEKLITDTIILKELSILLKMKKSGEEMGIAPRIEILHDYILSQLAYFRERLKNDLPFKQIKVSELDLVFSKTFSEAWVSEGK